jgi:hypothetical protein
MAFIVFHTAYKGRLAQVVTAEKALAIQHALDHPQDGLSEQQSEFLLAIKKVYHNTGSHIPGSAQKRSTRLIADENNLTHEGVLQGMNESIPRNDR